MRDENFMEEIRASNTEYKKRERRIRKGLVVGALSVFLGLVGVLFLLVVPNAYKIYPLVVINLASVFIFSSLFVIIKEFLWVLKDTKL